MIDYSFEFQDIQGSWDEKGSCRSSSVDFEMYGDDDEKDSVKLCKASMPFRRTRRVTSGTKIRRSKSKPRSTSRTRSQSESSQNKSSSTRPRNSSSSSSSSSNYSSSSISSSEFPVNSVLRKRRRAGNVLSSSSHATSDSASSDSIIMRVLFGGNITQKNKKKARRVLSVYNKCYSKEYGGLGLSSTVYLLPSAIILSFFHFSESFYRWVAF